MGRLIRSSNPKLKYIRGATGKSKPHLFQKNHIYRFTSLTSTDNNTPTDKGGNAPETQTLECVPEQPESCPGEIVFASNSSCTPKPPVTRGQITAEIDSSTEYFILPKLHLTKLINSTIKAHKKHNVTCDGEFEFIHHQQKIISTSWSMKCRICDFKSVPQKMYDENNLTASKTGPKPSTLNEALGFALLKSSIGAVQFREILLSLGINPGSHHGIHDVITKCGKVVTQLAEQNMFYERQKCKSKKDIGVSLDGWYPTKFSCGPWQASSQVTFTALDSITKKVLFLYTASKLCPQATKMRNLGIEVDCPGGHSKCTANLSKFDSIGQEGFYASETATIFKKENIEITHFCSDADSKIKNGFFKVFPHSKHYLDKNHLARSLKRGLINAKYSKNMFNLRTAKARNRAKTRFAGDMRYRVESEFSAFFKTLKSGTQEQKIEKMSAHVTKLIPTLISCFKGDHTLCAKHSRICGKEKKMKKNGNLNTK